MQDDSDQETNEIQAESEIGKVDLCRTKIDVRPAHFFELRPKVSPPTECCVLIWTDRILVSRHVSFVLGSADNRIASHRLNRSI